MSEPRVFMASGRLREMRKRNRFIVSHVVVTFRREGGGWNCILAMGYFVEIFFLFQLIYGDFCDHLLYQRLRYVSNCNVCNNYLPLGNI